MQKEFEETSEPFYFHSWKCIVSWFNFTPAVGQNPGFLSCEIGQMLPALRGYWEDHTK